MLCQLQCVSIRIMSTLEINLSSNTTHTPLSHSHHNNQFIAAFHVAPCSQSDTGETLAASPLDLTTSISTSRGAGKVRLCLLALRMRRTRGVILVHLSFLSPKFSTDGNGDPT